MSPHASSLASPSGTTSANDAEAAAARITALVEAHVDAVWRTLRRLGVPPSDLDDGVQKVFAVLTRRIGRIEPGKERSFLLGVALRVAADHRRSRRRHPEQPTEPSTLEATSRLAVTPESLLEERRRLELLDTLIADLPRDLAEVFVLFELEELTMAEISRLLAIPSGTVASRLRRARERFEMACRNLELGS